MGVYLLLDGVTGEPSALIDGPRLTQWRTACASALAASYLAREDASRLLIVGAGAQAAFLAKAHSAVRPIAEIRIWNRTRANAEKLAGELSAQGFAARAAGDLDAELGWADIVSAATISTTPLVKGALLKPGAHVDLVGGFTPAMRESDDDAIRRARIYVDTHAGATKEAGDIVQPLASGVLKAEAHRRRPARTCARPEEGPRKGRVRSRCSSRWARRSRIWRRASPSIRNSRPDRAAVLRGRLAVCQKPPAVSGEDLLKPSRDKRRDQPPRPAACRAPGKAGR